MTKTEKRMVDAINWACGVTGAFSPSPDAPRYWWRIPLAAKAGLFWNGKRFAIRAARKKEGRAKT